MVSGPIDTVVPPGVATHAVAVVREVEEEAGEPTVDPETGEMVYPEPPEIDSTPTALPRGRRPCAQHGMKPMDEPGNHGAASQLLRITRQRTQFHRDLTPQFAPSVRAFRHNVSSSPPHTRVSTHSAHCTLPNPDGRRGSLAASSRLVRWSQVTTFMKPQPLRCLSV